MTIQQVSILSKVHHKEESDYKSLLKKEQNRIQQYRKKSLCFDDPQPNESTENKL